MSQIKKNKKSKLGPRLGKSAIGPKKGKSAPLSKGFELRQTAPSFKPGPGGGIVVTHREYLRDIYGFELFNVDYNEINPGLPNTTPWLSHIASRYDFWKARKMRFHYVPMCGAATAGSVCMAVDYDVSDYEPTTVAQMSNYYGAVRSSVWTESTLDLDPAAMNKLVNNRMVRAEVIADVDPKLYDVGTFYISTSGCQMPMGTALVVGSVWVSYEIELSVPHLEDSVDSTECFKIASNASTKAHPLNGATYINGNAYVPIVQESDGLTSFTINKIGEYLFNWAATGTTLDATSPTITPDTGAATITNVGGIPNAAATAGFYDTLVNVTKPGSFFVTTPIGWTTLSALAARVAPFKSALF